MRKKDENWIAFKIGCTWAWEFMLRRLFATHSDRSFCNGGDSIYCLHRHKTDETVRITFVTRNGKYYIKIIPFTEFWILFWESADRFIESLKNGLMVEYGMRRPLEHKYGEENAKCW